MNNKIALNMFYVLRCFSFYFTSNRIYKEKLKIHKTHNLGLLKELWNSGGYGI